MIGKLAISEHPSYRRGMRLQMPWSGWFNNQAKKRKKVEPWLAAEVNMEEEFEIEKNLRDIFNYIDPDDIPDLISAFAVENYRLVKIVNQGRDYIKTFKTKPSSPRNKRNL